MFYFEHFSLKCIIKNNYLQRYDPLRVWLCLDRFFVNLRRFENCRCVTELLILVIWVFFTNGVNSHQDNQGPKWGMSSKFTYY